VKPWALVALTAGIVSAGLAICGSNAPPPQKADMQKAEQWNLVVSGSTDGYLSPCGCTSPMTGGIRRRATAIGGIEAKGKVVFIDTGGLAAVPGVQGQYKVETMAQSLAKMGAAAVALTAEDLRLGPNATQAEIGLAAGRIVSTTLSGAQKNGVGSGAFEGVVASIERGPFLIGATTDTRSLSSGAGISDVAAARLLVSLAEDRGKLPVLMLDAGHDDAVRIARTVPNLVAVVYRQSGWPPDRLERVGSVALLTPGERGKAIIQLTFGGTAITGYRSIRLGPEFKDDPSVSRYFKGYLSRVDAAHLLEQQPRQSAAGFTGSEECGKCHGAAEEVWRHSGHFHAYDTLEKQGQARDPDCVSCHVVGLDREDGFRSRELTPGLSSVGCESCHGAGAAHAASPKTAHFKEVTDATCISCHRAEQSPGFDFQTYLKKIAHK